jgi:hypothetical protein
MGRRGKKAIDTYLRQCLEEDNGTAFMAIVESAIRVAVSDGFVPSALDPTVLVFDPERRHPDYAKCNKEMLDRILGRPTQQMEVEVKHQIPFLLDPELIALHGAQMVEVVEQSEDGEVSTRQVFAPGSSVEDTFG